MPSNFRGSDQRAGGAASSAFRRGVLLSCHYLPPTQTGLLHQGGHPRTRRKFRGLTKDHTELARTSAPRGSAPRANRQDGGPGEGRRERSSHRSAPPTPRRARSMSPTKAGWDAPSRASRERACARAGSAEVAPWGGTRYFGNTRMTLMGKVAEGEEVIFIGLLSQGTVSLDVPLWCGVLRSV